MRERLTSTSELSSSSDDSESPFFDALRFIGLGGEGEGWSISIVGVVIVI